MIFIPSTCLFETAVGGKGGRETGWVGEELHITTTDYMSSATNEMKSQQLLHYHLLSTESRKITSPIWSTLIGECDHHLI